jgi:hypothetical protein
MTTLLRAAPDDPAGSPGPTGTAHRTGTGPTAHPTGTTGPTAHPTGTAEPAGRSWLSRLLAVVGPAAGAVGLAFGARVSPHAVAVLLRRDSRWSL